MNLYSRLSSLPVSEGGTPKVQGHWFPIRIQPLLSTGEVLNVGIAFQGPDGSLQTKLLDQFDRLECLYGTRVSAEEVSFLLRCVKESLASSGAEVPEPPSPNIDFGQREYAAGDSVAAILDDLFSSVVTLAQPTSPRLTLATSEAPVADRKTIRQRVFGAMLERSAWSQNLISKEEWVVKDGDVARRLDLPLRGPGVFAALESAYYRGAQTLEMHLLRAEVNLSTAARLHEKDRGALFIARPCAEEPGFTAEQLRAIDNHLDKLEWEIRKVQGFHLAIEEDNGRLAEDILDWASVA